MSPHRLVWILSGIIATMPAWALGPLNDTGVQFCGEAEDGNNAPCTGSEPAGQDAHYGRDAAAAGQLTKIGGGGAGFDFTKIANDGTVLPASATLGRQPTDWACTRDNVTKLVWEVKTDDNGRRDQDWTYTWYDPKSPDGNPGDEGNTGTCNETLGAKPCNTRNYAAAIRAAKLCGYGDWRMPTIKELEGIADLGRVNPAIDPDYFPYTSSSNVWSGSPSAYGSNYAWYVNFGNGYAYYYHFSRSDSSHVRLVRGGQ